MKNMYICPETKTSYGHGPILVTLNKLSERIPSLGFAHSAGLVRKSNSAPATRMGLSGCVEEEEATKDSRDKCGETVPTSSSCTLCSKALKAGSRCVGRPSRVTSWDLHVRLAKVSATSTRSTCFCTQSCTWTTWGGRTMRGSRGAIQAQGNTR